MNMEGERIGHPPIKINHYSHQWHGNEFVSKRNKYFCGMCFDIWYARAHACPILMVVADFWPGRNEGCAVNEKDPGNGHRITKKVGRKVDRKAVGLPRKMPDGFIQRARPIFVFAKSLVEKCVLWVL